MLATSLLVLSFSTLPFEGRIESPSPLSPLPPTTVQEGISRGEERANKKLKRATEERDIAYRKLAAVYEACDFWVRSDEISEPPPALQHWFDKEGLGTSRTLEQRAHAKKVGSFHELWNQSIYLLTREAKAYETAVAKLEKAFLAAEKFRHPARFEKGFDRIPPGMVLIPGDRYDFGPATGWFFTHPKWSDTFRERIRPFYLDKKEVTNAAYQQFLLAQPPSLRLHHLPLNWQLDSSDLPIYPPGFGSLPVTGVTWQSAHKYAEWLGKRLPTEIEWEIAAKGKENRRYPLGNAFSAAKVNCSAFGLKGPGPADDFPEDVTPMGIQCMTGNVREWTADLYIEPETGVGKAKDVKKLAPEVVAIVRGGSFKDKPSQCASSYRWPYPALDSRLAHVGFRCAKSVK